MKKLYRWLFAALLLILILGGLFFWPAVCLNGMSRQAAAAYRSHFAPHPLGELKSVISHYEWAIAFGGQSGLSELRPLIDDPNLTAAGRRDAQETYDYIRSGKHTVELGNVFHGSSGWNIARHPLGSELLGYIYLHDLISTKSFENSVDPSRK